MSVASADAIEAVDVDGSSNAGVGGYSESYGSSDAAVTFTLSA